MLLGNISQMIEGNCFHEHVPGSGDSKNLVVIIAGHVQRLFQSRDISIGKSSTIWLAFSIRIQCCIEGLNVTEKIEEIAETAIRLGWKSC
jgi:hypothetical protein